MHKLFQTSSHSKHETMKKNINISKFFLFITLFIALFSSCSKKDSTSPPIYITGTGAICSGCQDYSFVKKFNKIEGIVRQINQNEYTYQKQRYYIEVDSKDIIEVGETGPVRIFTCDAKITLNEHINKKVIITGDIHDCLTEYHGQPTLNLYTFHVLN